MTNTCWGKMTLTIFLIAILAHTETGVGVLVSH